MATEIRVPTLGESVTEATIGRWFKKARRRRQGRRAAGRAGNRQGDARSQRAVRRRAGRDRRQGRRDRRARRGARPASPKAPCRRGRRSRRAGRGRSAGARCRARACRQRTVGAGAPPSPAAAKIAADRGIDVARRRRLRQGRPGAQGRRARPIAASSAAAAAPAAPSPSARRPPPDDAAREERVRMTKLRQTIARRLKEAQNTAAMLTTFNEVDMSAVMALRSPVQGRVREEARREARLHGLLREGLRPRAQGNPGGQRRDRRDRPHLQELLPHRRRRRHRQGPGRAGGARRRPAVDRRGREGDRRPRQARPRRPAQDRRHAGRHLHHLQRRRLRLADVDADPQRAAVGHSRHAQDPGAARWSSPARSKSAR